MKQLAAVVLVIAALLPSAWLAWRARDMPHLGAAHDDAIYWICAKSLADGKGYRTLSAPEAPYQTYYPPAYPLLLSLVWRLDPSFPQNLPSATLFNWMLLPLFVATCISYFHETGFGWAAWVLGALTALLPIVALSSLRLMPDLLFCALIIITVIALDRAVRMNSAALIAAAGILAVLSFLTKGAGIALVVAGALSLALVYRRLKYAGLFLGAASPFVVAWFWWVHVHSAAGFREGSQSLSNYSDYLLHGTIASQRLTMAATNITLLYNALPNMFVPASGWKSGLLDVAAIAGALLLFRKGRSRTYVVFALTYSAMLIAWPYPPDIRLTLPVLPLLLASISAVIRTAWSTISTGHESAVRTIIAASCLGLAAIGTGISVIASVGTLRHGIPQFISDQRNQNARNMAAYDWVRTNTRENDRFLASAAPVFFLYTGREAAAPDLPADYWYRNEPSRTREWSRIVPSFARAHGLTHAFLTSSDVGLDDATIEQALRDAGWLRLVSPCDGCVIYEVPPGR